MNTYHSTTYEYGPDGQFVKQTVTREEVPAGELLDINGLTEAQIAHLVAIRNAFKKDPS